MAADTKAKVKSHLARYLEKKSYEASESTARWATDHPGLPPGYNPKGPTWGSYSKQRKPTQAFRDGYDRIVWSEDAVR